MTSPCEKWHLTVSQTKVKLSCKPQIIWPKQWTARPGLPIESLFIACGAKNGASLDWLRPEWEAVAISEDMITDSLTLMRATVIYDGTEHQLAPANAWRFHCQSLIAGPSWQALISWHFCPSLLASQPVCLLSLILHHKFWMDDILYVQRAAHSEIW